MSALGLEARSLLEFLVRHVRSVDPADPRTFVSYKDVHEALRLQPIGKFGASLQRQGLDELAEWTVAQGLPAITGVVIDRAKLQPGDGYFKLLGYPSDPYGRWRDEITHAKEMDWSARLSALESAARASAPADSLPADPRAANTWRLVAYHEPDRAEAVASEMMKRGVIAVGWSDIGDLSKVPPVDGGDIGRRISRSYPDSNNSSLGGPSLWRMFREMDVGDLVIVTAKSRRIAVVEIISDYYYSDVGVAGYSHLRSVAPTTIDPEELWRVAGERADVGESIRWTVARLASGGRSARYAYWEGARYEIRSTAIERNPAAREACIEHHGVACYACGFDFYQQYGDMGTGYIHVHHRNDISLTTGPCKVDPIKDLVPLCPNCHAMVHCERPAIDVDAFKKMIRERGKAT